MYKTLIVTLRWVLQAYDHALGVVKARISKPAPDFTAAAVVKGKFEDLTLSSYKGMWYRPINRSAKVFCHH